MTHEQAKVLVSLVLRGDRGHGAGRGVVEADNTAWVEVIKELASMGYVTISEGRAPGGYPMIVDWWTITPSGLSAVMDPIATLVASGLEKK